MATNRNDGFKLEIRDNIDSVRAVVDKEYPKAVSSAGAIAINRALRKGLTLTKRKLAKRMGVPQKFIKDRIKYTRAYRSNLRGKIRVTGRPLNVARFGAQQYKEGVKHGAWQPGSRKKLAKRSFLVKIKSPKSSLTHFVAHRPGGGRKMEGVWGPWPVQEFIGHKQGTDRGARPEVAKEMLAYFETQLIYETQRQIDIANGKISKTPRRRGSAASRPARIGR